MKLCVPANYNFEFIHKIDQMSSSSDLNVHELFGSYHIAEVGSLRPAIWLPRITEEDLKKYINECEDRDMEFNYVLNSTCLGNLENTYDGHHRIIDFLNKLFSTGVKCVTVSIPYLISLIKQRFPNIKVICSITNDVNSVEKAREFAALGVDRIVLSRDINRNFELLKKVRKAVQVELEVLANSRCLLNCIFNQAHGNSSSHASNALENEGYAVPFNSFYFAQCQIRRLSDPVALIKSPWIRPEDLKIYEQIGIDYLKIDGRGKDNEGIIKIVKPYLERRFEGNFVELLDSALSKVIYLDNRKLDNFLNYFVTKGGNCNTDCIECDYCHQILEKFVTINEELKDQNLSQLQRILRQILEVDLPKKKYLKKEFEWKLSLS